MRPLSARAIGPLTLAIACVTSSPPCAVPPSRRSIASREPRDAPAGAMARATTPAASVTSASTVGRPRESHTRRPCTLEMMALMLGFLWLSVGPPQRSRR